MVVVDAGTDRSRIEQPPRELGVAGREIKVFLHSVLMFFPVFTFVILTTLCPFFAFAGKCTGK